MSNRLYRTLIGLTILLGLYFEQPMVLNLLAGIVLLEGITNLRIPLLVNRIRWGHDGDQQEGNLAISFRTRFSFEAERAWRLSVGMVLLLVLSEFQNSLWFFPWFMGFAILGAGASGVCPMFLSFKWMGFR